MPPAATNTPLQKLLQRQFPTLLGIGVLVVALVAGIFLISTDTGVFSPRASAEATPKAVKITNLTDTGFTISFLTDAQVAGFLKYSETASKLSQQISDDRDQISGTVGQYQTHHISVRSLKPNTTYYYEIGTGTGSTFDNAGQPFTITTLASGGTPTAAKTVYGKILSQTGNPADGAIIYLSINGVGELSGLAKNSGSWAIPLSSARQANGAYADITDNTQLNILAQGNSTALISNISTTVGQAQPVPDITLGQNTVVEEPSNSEFNSLSEVNFSQEEETQVTSTGGLEEALELETATNTTLDLSLLDEDNASASDSADKPILDTTTPVFKGQAAPIATVKITINSDTQIQQTVTSDENGDFELDLSEIEAQLEPGEHSIEYCYTDEETLEDICQIKYFTVAEGSTLLAQAETNQYPYGSGNPYTIDNKEELASEEAEASESSSSSKGGVMPSTSSGVPVSGSVETTLALLIGGVFFILAGAWSYFLSQKANQ